MQRLWQSREAGTLEHEPRYTIAGCENVLMKFSNSTLYWEGSSAQVFGGRGSRRQKLSHCHMAITFGDAAGE